MGLLEVIKTAGTQAVDAGNPVAILYGEVKSINPLEVIVDQRFSLTADFLIVPESLTKYELDLKHYHTHPYGSTGQALDKVVIRPGLAVGDGIILLRKQGGQQYLILDKVVTQE